MRRPGFAQLHYCAQERKVRLVRKQILDNRSKGTSEKSAPRCLKEIGDLVADWSASKSIRVFVRE